MQSAKQKILVGLSGGVDSSVAAYLLKKQGYEVHAVFMKNFTETFADSPHCTWKEDRAEAYRAAKFLKIPIETWNFEREYEKSVVQYMFREYEKGLTPNPDIMCNKEIKFKIFIDRAREVGFEYVATGHYAGIKRDKKGLAHLLKGKDANKDQSYFLASVAQSQLQHVIFPLADMTKPEVRALAKRIKLPNAARKDSQGICFIGQVPMEEFLKTRLKKKPGDIVDEKGNLLGKHNGVSFYTIGQRHGLHVAGGVPLYVVRKNIKRNQVIVSPQPVESNELLAHALHWIATPLKLPFKAIAKIRYRQPDQSCIVRKKGSKLLVKFTKPQRSISPGQTVAFYKGRELVGSVVID